MTLDLGIAPLKPEELKKEEVREWPQISLRSSLRFEKSADSPSKRLEIGGNRFSFHKFRLILIDS